MDINTLVRDNIKKLKPYSSAREIKKGEGFTFLDANENPHGEGLNRYPDPLQETLKEKIAAGKNIDPSKIFLGNGSDEVIDLMIRAFAEPRFDNIITTTPSYSMYKVAANINDVEVREVLLDDDFQPDISALMDAADEHTKLAFLCSPNNPTGNLMEENRVRELLDRFHGIVILDEAYVDFAPSGSMLDLINRYENLMVSRTFSKAQSLAGIRLGIGFTHPDIVSVLNKVKYPYNVNELTQQAAIKALDKQDEYKRHIDEIIEERKRLERELPKLPVVEKVYPSDANFLLVKVSRPQELIDYLDRQSIIIRDRSNMPLCENAVRITVGNSEQNNRLLEAMKTFS